MKNTSELKKADRLPTTKRMTVAFLIFFAANVFVCIVFGIASGGDSLKEMLFHNKNYTDLFMDFFNTIRDAGSPDVYSARNNIYPPLCVLFFRFLSKLISPNLVSSRFEMRTSLQLDNICMMIYVVFTCVCILAMLRLIESYSFRHNHGSKYLFANLISFAMVVSYPVIFCIERGNILILSVVLAMFYLFFKDSDNKVVRELSYVSLALSAGMKIYPAIFGLTLIYDKKFKEAGRLVLYGFIAVVLPIVFFLDFGTNAAAITSQAGAMLNSYTNAASADSSMLMKLFDNLIKFATTKKSSYNASSVSIENFVLFFDSYNAIGAKIACAVTEVIAFIASIKVKDEWKRVFLLTYLMLNISAASSSYALSFLIIPFCIFMFGQKKYKKSDWIYLTCYALLLTPLPTFWYYYPAKVKEFYAYFGLAYNSQLNQNIGFIVFQFMFFFIVFECINDILLDRKTKKAVAVKAVEAAVPDNTDTASEEAS